MTLSYYQKVVSVTENYLGPAAERFIRRQIDFHLSKEPETITKQDITQLKNSLGVALGLLVSDKSLIEAAKKEFESIT